MRKLLLAGIALVGLSGAALANDYVGATLSDREQQDHYSQVLSSATTLKQTDCGKTFLLSAATEFATTLPTPRDGCYLKFIVANQPEAADYTVITSGTEILYGGINELEVDTGDDGPLAAADADTISFRSGTADGAGDNALIGDYVEMVSDGTYWYLNGQAKGDGAIAFTSAI